MDKLIPENDLESKIINDPEFQKGLSYGKPRPGHPEGKVLFHIKEVLNNIENLDLSIAVERHKIEPKEFKDKLRLIALIHDTFKYKVDNSKPKFGENHHGYKARKFAEKYIDDIGILKVIELHDDAYNAWQIGNRKNDWEKAKKRIRDLFSKFRELSKEDPTRYLSSWGDMELLYIKFYYCDNNTGNKSKEPLIWFSKIFCSEYQL